ncbi:hypothetical protein BAUCODRAFT_34772 [Baudoinia panamericana UAMH 10762]|uniref:Cytochrome b561 domain-containing protein n=1 Tax=Baudoinia panamericana (strain UAMH 10762) TaxID=717646 RepID=M2NA57_BAUPA|nr:uncharacterized protein BAUCODRAFT_34772 [Baudoinia panamericana UAMH 10762]EMC96004.1 hypothetical protein BAUCODRAFT_34772 [Baudoinia panamericana UAMH 10762]
MAEAVQQQQQPSDEQAPLLGGPGDASQQNKPLYYNFIIGTGVVAQGGAWILAAIVWGSVFSNQLILFSAHPLLNSAAVLFFIQGILILQPTHTAKQKKQGTFVHAALNDIAALAAVAGLVVIECTKVQHHGAHFQSVHAILGLITYILVAMQALVGITQFFTPGLYGSVDNAKALYKYHRACGYLTLLVMLATVCAATQTTFNKNVLGMQLWAVVVASVIVVLGVGARIKPSKFGWLAGN